MKKLLQIPAPPARRNEGELVVGDIVDDRFRVVRLLGEGSAGRVYEAVQLSVERRVAIKVLRPSHQTRDDYKERFSREAKAIARLSHSRCITLHDFGYSEELKSLYMVMEFVEGRELHAIIEDGPIPLRTALLYAIQISEALGHAHEKGILHRDLKPENVLITDSGGVKVLDFGLTRIMDEIESKGGRRLTEQGMVYGTPVYMSPEQCEGDMGVDARSDIYSLGVMLYELFEGQPPFDSPEILKVLVSHVNDSVPPMSESVPQALRDLIMQMLSKRQDGRPRSASEVTDTLHAILVSNAMEAGQISPDISQEISRSLLKRDRDESGEVAARALQKQAPASGKKADKSPTVQLVGCTLNSRYRLTKIIGSGATGTVFEATTTDGTRVALKVLSRDTHHALKAEERFGREERALSAISHPNVVKSLECGRDDAFDREYIAMELVDGVALDARLKVSPLGLGETLSMAYGIAQALVAAHRAGVIHRDIKPANIMLAGNDPAEPRVLDFGLALVGDEGRLTLAGEAVGSVAYMSPETLKGEVADESSDIYGLGLVMFEALTGSRAFEGEPPPKVARAILTGPPIVLEPSADIPRSVAGFVTELLKPRGDRPSSAQDVADHIAALQNVLSPQSDEPDRRKSDGPQPSKSVHPRSKEPTSALWAAVPRPESAPAGAEEPQLDEASEVVWQPTRSKLPMVLILLLGGSLAIVALAMTQRPETEPAVDEVPSVDVPVDLPRPEISPSVNPPEDAGGEPDLVEVPPVEDPQESGEPRPKEEPPPVVKPDPAEKPPADLVPKPKQEPAVKPKPKDPKPESDPLPTLDFNY